ncbi:MAG: type II secretion system F family protein, partial [Bdellovibrio sp.]
MAKFQYQAKNPAGQIIQGEIEAASQQEAVVRLRAQQLVPIRIVQFGASRSSAGKSASLFAARVKGKDLQVFTRQFATLINAGIPVVDSLKILSEGLRPGLLKEASAQVKGSIESGRRLADSMAQVPNVFDKLYVNMIQAGEEAGILDGILNRLALYMEKSEKLKSQVKGA